MKTHFRPVAIILPAVLFALYACDPYENTAGIPEQEPERIDIRLTGDLELTAFQWNQGNVHSDLVGFGFHGDPSPQFDFHIHLPGGYRLFIRLFDAQNLNPWQQVDVPYNIYPGEDLEDKLAYADILLFSQEGICVYSTNQDPDNPRGALLDVFRITANTGSSIRARIRDMVLYRHQDADRAVHVNGTFSGTVDF